MVDMLDMKYKGCGSVNIETLFMFLKTVLGRVALGKSFFRLMALKKIRQIHGI